MRNARGNSKMISSKVGARGRPEELVSDFSRSPGVQHVEGATVNLTNTPVYLDQSERGLYPLLKILLSLLRLHYL
jgi:hypothetical protein